ncbi:MAG TPA: NUDIX domain-containing protein [Pyrinomonadaceae bacterium]
MMLKKPIRFAWKILPPRLRLGIIRATQRKFTVSAAAIITNMKGEVLLLNHVLRPFSGWGLPGGFLSKGEQPEAAIRREIIEETGIELDELRMFRVRTLGRHVEILFAARTDGEPEVRSREILELGWFDIESMPEQMSSAQKKMIQEAVSG